MSRPQAEGSAAAGRGIERADRHDVSDHSIEVLRAGQTIDDSHQEPIAGVKRNQGRDARPVDGPVVRQGDNKSPGIDARDLPQHGSRVQRERGGRLSQMRAVAAHLQVIVEAVRRLLGEAEFRRAVRQRRDPGSRGLRSRTWSGSSATEARPLGIRDKIGTNDPRRQNHQSAWATKGRAAGRRGGRSLKRWLDAI